jgi:integrase
MLTDTKIKHLLPGDKTIRYFDGGGLYLEVTPAGGRYWRMKFRFLGKENRLSFGTYPQITLKEARVKRDEAKKLVANGQNPAIVKKDKKRTALVEAGNAFEGIAREWIDTNKGKWTERHARYLLRRLEADIFPAFGQRPINQITPSEVLSTLRTIEARGATDLPNRVRSTISQVFRYAIITERCTTNPASDLQGALKPHKKQHQHAVNSDNLPQLLRDIEGYNTLAGGDVQTKLALQFLALTFVRTGELRGARWEEFDLKTCEWRIPAERMKMRAPHVVPLAQQSLDILEQLRGINGHYPFVFAGRSPQRPMSENTVLFALYRLGYRGRMTGHGFRAVASTLLNEMGYRPDVIERQLAHKEANEVRAAYHRSEYLSERHKMMKEWADYLDAQRQVGVGS